MKYSAALAIGFGLVLLALLLAPIKTNAREMIAAMDLVHGPAFAVLGWIVYVACERRLPQGSLAAVLTVWGPLVVFGAGAEYAQGFVERTVTLGDAVANILGATIGVLFAHGRRRPAQRTLTRGGILLACVALAAVELLAMLELADSARQRLDMPRLASFENRLEMLRWEPFNAEMERIGEHATEGDWALRLRMRPGRYTGVTMIWPPRDWSGYHELLLDCTLDDDEPLELVVKVQDEWHSGEHHDRFHHVARLVPGLNAVRILLSDVEHAPRDRGMQMDRIKYLEFFTGSLTHPRTVILDNIRLQ